MPKKKAPTHKAKGLKKQNTKNSITIQNREIKISGRKFDSSFLEMKLWIPLWELQNWVTQQDWVDLHKQVKDLAGLRKGGKDEA